MKEHILSPAWYTNATLLSLLPTSRQILTAIPHLRYFAPPVHFLLTPLQCNGIQRNIMESQRNVKVLTAMKASILPPLPGALIARPVLPPLRPALRSRSASSCCFASSPGELPSRFPPARSHCSPLLRSTRSPLLSSCRPSAAEIHTCSCTRHQNKGPCEFD